MRRLETRSAGSAAPAPAPFLEGSCRLAFFSAEPIAHRGRGRERERPIQWLSVFPLFLNPKVETCLGTCTSSGGGRLWLFFFFLPLFFFFFLRWMTEVFYCEVGKNCQFRWSTDSFSSLSIRLFFNNQQLRAERHLPQGSRDSTETSLLVFHFSCPSCVW